MAPPAAEARLLGSYAEASPCLCVGLFAEWPSQQPLHLFEPPFAEPSVEQPSAIRLENSFEQTCHTLKPGCSGTPSSQVVHRMPQVGASRLGLLSLQLLASCQPLLNLAEASEFAFGPVEAAVSVAVAAAGRAD